MSQPEIKTWRERAGLAPDYQVVFATAVEKAMLEEIADLRARLELPEPVGKKPIDPRQIDIFGEGL